MEAVPDRGEYRVTSVVALPGLLTSPTFTPDPSRSSWHSLTPSQVTRRPRALGKGNLWHYGVRTIFPGLYKEFDKVLPSEDRGMRTVAKIRVWGEYGSGGDEVVRRGLDNSVEYRVLGTRYWDGQKVKVCGYGIETGWRTLGFRAKWDG
ncbi:hypothetical protein Pmani_035460 [Petrolisthes manimaculis]|uniref:Uncharacterized protein n=1 Tax=Petrolisthes manimaculis TaxID=1843537 RepID=A0AAE1TN68_9EUCA|nr:hypothetical protein Pmani_035460 [Petrolisthes manimaculis]